MNNVIIKSPWVVGNLSLRRGSIVQISIVAYEHWLGIPARFCAGLIPAVEISRQLRHENFQSVVRVIDPTPIADYCNGWQPRQLFFRAVIEDFFNNLGVVFFFDEAEQMSSGSLEVLSALGAELESTIDSRVVDMVQRIKTSGKKHGGDLGASNALLYMAAHPFSWLDMHHPLIWNKSYSSGDKQFVNLMSQAEERFVVIRKFLCAKRPDLCTDNKPVDRFITTCKTPCYIPLRDEPLFVDLTTHGPDWCYERYSKLKEESKAHAHAEEDFATLMSFFQRDRR